MQQILLTMIRGTPRLEAPLAQLSPWVDWLVESEESLFSRLEDQVARRVVKTHTPLDGVRLVSEADYVVVLRDPLDLAVSLYHQAQNLDRKRVAELSGRRLRKPTPLPPLHDWLLDWTRNDVDRTQQMDSLQGVVHHAVDAFARAAASSNVHIVRYEVLIADLPGEMARLAVDLEIPVGAEEWPGLVEAATFESMRAEAAHRVPSPDGVLKDPSAFFRRGRPGNGREILDADEVLAYAQRVRQLVRATTGPDHAGRVAALLGVGD